MIGGERYVRESWRRKWPRRRKGARPHGRFQSCWTRRQVCLPQLRTQGGSRGRPAMLSEELPQVWYEDDPRLAACLLAALPSASSAGGRRDEGWPAKAARPSESVEVGA
jgi:hypothetical protein